MAETAQFAPGWPGIEPRWTSSAKQGVGSSLNPASRVWFTLSHGIFNEIYYPRVDQACTRDMGMLVASDDFFSEEKRDAESRISMFAPGVPAFRLVNTASSGRYRIEKRILTDPRREVVLQWTKFTALSGQPADYRLYVLLSPHIANRGWGNTGWLGDYKGVPMLFAERDGTCLALASSAPWLTRSVGFVGSSDGWQDISRNRRMEWKYERAENGNIALTGQIDHGAAADGFVLAVGFGRNAAEAGNRALASVSSGFDHAEAEYVREWSGWLEEHSAHGGVLSAARRSASETREELRASSGRTAAGAASRAVGMVSRAAGTKPPDAPPRDDLALVSAALIRAHEAKNFPGGLIASLSVPWGFSKSDDDLGGYHLVWPRDLVETAGGLCAAGVHELLDRVLHYLQSTQEPDGHWPQNMWMDGTPYWPGIQMDEAAFPILLADLGFREKAIGPEERARFWPMVKRAASFIARNGPVTPQDRWEEDPGYSPFTLAVEVSALLVAADFADANREPGIGTYLRDTADAWNDGIERWIYVQGTELALKIGVQGYYVRIAPPDTADAPSPAGGFVPIKNRPPGQGMMNAAQMVSPDALALVRFGLRDPADPRIRDTLRVIDALLKVETPFGPAWHRYNDDGYGEHDDGSPFDGTGVGRAWPLITGERAHYEIAAGKMDEARRLCRAMEAFAGDGGLIPEQIWDSDDVPGRGLKRGRPSGSAMPLLWAHAEYLKLRRSLDDGKVFDTPPQTVARYVKGRMHSPFVLWRPNLKCRAIQAGKTLRVETFNAARVRWSADGWQTSREGESCPTGLGVYITDIPSKDLKAGSRIDFKIFWPDEDRWEESSYCVVVGG
jgi:glucoamylase